MKDQVFKIIEKELERQTEMIGLIPSENIVSPDVSEVLSSCLSNKYSEGYSNRRYYEGNQFIDQIELLAIERVKKLFGVPFVNVQPYSGSPANLAIYFALIKPGDTILGLKLSMGGHLTHGHPKVTASGTFYNSVQYGLNKNARIDFDEVRELALKHKPKIIVAGNTSYPFELDFKKFREIADEVGAWLMADISHVTGLVITGEHMSPVPYADVIMSTTHKTFRGPRGAMILVTDKGLERDPKLGSKIDSAIIPGLQGGPHNATTAGIAIAAGEALKPEFKNYARQIKKNATALANALKKRGFTLVGDGTETHLILIDLTNYGISFGTQAAFAMDVAGIYANRNTVPTEKGSPFYPSGLRIGTPLVTTRGMKEADMEKIANWMFRAIEEVRAYQLPEDMKERRIFIKQFRIDALKNKNLLKIRKEVTNFTKKFKLFAW
ncbi:MAG: serine hydroxymethyltransferase [Candidatus Pacebacteria bacterium CG_4_10_14_3_um_filter_34_15]|nr:serine hydroxymethyltransferase [Candidatus Pacearchaeota archaeon]NCQ65965.1 serine hydroxymethyltransferase [Candidatus Paceibacterota bacterium]PIX81202.1 MAG: serine hydroxymethyltransferase [Candidatus Pacebacteria bacterium CG_4_10_14_3_um_filter_34_15]